METSQAGGDNVKGATPNKRPRNEVIPQSDHPKTGTKSDESAYHQGASFGLNFVTFAEYSGLRSEHEKLQALLDNLKRFVEVNIGQSQESLKAEINQVKEENKRLREEVKQLRLDLQRSGVVIETNSSSATMCSSPSTPPPIVASTSSTINTTAVQPTAQPVEGRLCTIENQLANVQAAMSGLPPAPSSETVTYLHNLANFYTPSSNNQVSYAKQSSVVTSSPVKQSAMDENATTAAIKSVVSSLLPLPAAIQSLPCVPLEVEAASGSTANQLPEDVSWQTEVQLTPAQPVPEESPYSLKVQLLPKYNIWVNRSKLTNLLQDGMSQTENAPLYLLRKLIPMVFSWEELAFSRGQGITSKNREAGKAPLDSVKINACKDFMRLFCSQNNLVEPPDTAINTQFTHTITYARTKMKRSLGKPNCRVTTLLSDNPISSPIKSEQLDDSLQFAEETNLDLSTLGTDLEPSPPGQDDDNSVVTSQYFNTAME